MQFANDASNNNNQSLIYLVILVLSLFSLAKMIHPMVESFFTGFGARNSDFGQRIAQSGLSSATNSIQQGASNIATSARSQLSSLKANQTQQNSVSSSGQASSSSSNGGGGNSNSGMNTPITMKSVAQGAGKAILAVAKATSEVGGSMAKEAFGINSNSNSSNNNQASQESHKKFPTEYTPPSSNK